jgi:hypothetical protein
VQVVGRLDGVEVMEDAGVVVLVLDGEGLPFRPFRIGYEPTPSREVVDALAMELSGFVGRRAAVGATVTVGKGGRPFYRARWVQPL